MNIHHKVLEFHIVLEKVAAYAHSTAAANALLSLSPILDETLCQRAILDTSGAKKLLETCGNPPIAAMESISD